jgi:hypothetical protein
MTNPILVPVHGMQFHEEGGNIFIYNSVTAIRFRNEIFFKETHIIQYLLYFNAPGMFENKFNMTYTMHNISRSTKIFLPFFVIHICVGTYKNGM